jgi:hypothetical protein
MLQLYPAIHFTKEENLGKTVSVSPKSARKLLLRRLGLLSTGNLKRPADFSRYRFKAFSGPFVQPSAGTSAFKVAEAGIVYP